MIDIDNIKPGNNLEKNDWLFINESDRNTLLPLLEEQYDIKFIKRVPNPTLSISFTSQKCIISDVNEKKYLLKRKPTYSLKEPQKSRAALVQSELSKNLSFIPVIIFTKQGYPYSRIGNAFFLLTQYIDGNYFAGRINQSIACALALGGIHKTASQILLPQEDFFDSTLETIGFIGMVERLNFIDVYLKKFVLSKMRVLVNKYKATNVGKKGWLHGDFSPYNVVFSGDQLIAVNDFDNATYGVLSRDIAECLLTHSGINYVGATSSLKAPIQTTIDIQRMERMLKAYMHNNLISKKELIDLPNQMALIWLELMALGLLRGDYSLKDVQIALFHCEDIYQTSLKLIST